MSLSVCLLTRNDAASLGRALDSVSGLAEEVLVADTGSTDATTAIARSRGARLLVCPWEDDFAAARNFVVLQARGDWILWITGLEEVPAASHRPIGIAMTRSDIFGYAVLVEEMVRPDAFHETLDIRLFRRRQDLRFVGRIHPSFAPGLAEVLEQEGLRTYISDIRIRHHAYLSDRDEAKMRWMVRLLEKELTDRPGQLSYQIEYGYLLHRLGLPESGRVLAEASAEVQSASQSSVPPTRNVQVLLRLILTEAPESVTSTLSRAQARALAARWFPDSPPLLWTEAALAYESSDYRQAARVLEHLIGLGQTQTYDRTARFDPVIFGEDALANLGACYWHLQEYTKAEACYQKLATSPKYGVEAQRNLEQIHKSLGAQGNFGFSVQSNS